MYSSRVRRSRPEAFDRPGSSFADHRTTTSRDVAHRQATRSTFRQRGRPAAEEESGVRKSWIVKGIRTSNGNEDPWKKVLPDKLVGCQSPTEVVSFNWGTGRSKRLVNRNIGSGVANMNTCCNLYLHCTYMNKVSRCS